jgi:hypothetical protein
VVPILGVMNEVPVPKERPPVETLYQFSVPEEAAAPKVTVPASHRLAGVVAVIDGVAFTVAVTAVLGETQLPLVDCT